MRWSEEVLFLREEMRKILAFFAEMNKGFSWIAGMHYISLLASGQAFTSLLLTTIMSQSQDGT